MIIKFGATLLYLYLGVTMFPHPLSEFATIIIPAGMLYGMVLGGSYD